MTDPGDWVVRSGAARGVCRIRLMCFPGRRGHTRLPAVDGAARSGRGRPARRPAGPRQQVQRAPVHGSGATGTGCRRWPPADPVRPGPPRPLRLLRTQSGVLAGLRGGTRPERDVPAARPADCFGQRASPPGSRSGAHLPHAARRGVPHRSRPPRRRPHGALDEPELIRVMLPVLRADFTAAETYVHAAGTPLDCPVAVYTGDTDSSVPRAQLTEWERVTHVRPVRHRVFAGDHFYLDDARRPLLRALRDDLQEAAQAGRAVRR